MQNDPVALIRDKIQENQRIVITSHLRPDGDSLCTSLALYFMGKSLGKKMAIINEDPTPSPFNNFPDMNTIKTGQIPAQGFDLVILLECANVSRSGQVNIDRYFKINIDHHYSNDYYADINWVQPKASAVGEMAFMLGEKMNIRFTPRIANHLYCAIVSDTGSFQFSNTHSQAFRVCHKLAECGARPVKISELLFNNNSPEKIMLLGQVLSTLQMNKKGNIATITMFKHFLDKLNLKGIDTEDITTLARSIKGVQIVLFFKEIKNETFRVSLRSKGTANAAKVAEYFGGGGHVHAAGFTATGKYEDLLKTIPEKVNQLLNKKDKIHNPKKTKSQH